MPAGCLALFGANMVRFFSVHRTATEGTHLHIVRTSYARTMDKALEELRQYRTATAPNQSPVLFFDFGPAADLVRLDKITSEQF